MAASAIDAEERTAPPLTDHCAARRRYFEYWIARAAEDVAVTQVVIAPLGGGTWANRIEWAPHIRLFEIRYDDWEARLAARGYDPGLPSAWLLESATRRLLPAAGRLTAFGSVIAAETGGIADPRGLLRAHGFEVSAGTPDGTVQGRRR